MVFRVLKVILLGLFVELCFISCASKPLQYKNAKELSKIEEFDKIVQVKEIPTEKPADPNAVATPAKPEEKSAEQKIVAVKPPKTKKSKKAEVVDTRRQPLIEDSEGFEGRRPKVDPFHVGEKVTMMMTYFGVSAGDMILSTLPYKMVNGRKSYHFHVALKSSSLFSMFYLVDDWGETFVDYETLLPASLSINATETKKLLALKSVFDHSTNKAFRWEREVRKDEEPRERKIEWQMQPFSQNTLSAFEYIRVFQLTPGKTLHFRVADDAKDMLVKIEILRKETIKTLKGEFNTVVLKPTVEVGGIFQPMGNVFFWVTDDERKLIVRLEAEIKIGKVIGILKDFEKGEP
jgi:hypothetical protein